MSRCRNCGPGPCTCSFDSSLDAAQTGNGRSYAPINFRPISVPLPRPYGNYVRNLSNQNIGSSVEVALEFDSIAETPFSGSMVDPDTTPGTPKSRLTVPVGGDGYYLVSGFASFTRAGYQLTLRKNGAEHLARQTSGATIALFNGAIRSVNTLVDLVAGDYLELVCVSTATSGATIRFDFGTFYFTGIRFWAQWMRGL